MAEAASALLRWFTAFGVASTWISDRGSHFKNSLMHSLNRLLHSQHHFTAPNSPHANGTVERVCREVLRCCRALLSEFRLKEQEWPQVLPIIQSVLNNSVVASLGNKAPLTAFTDLPADNPIRLILPSSTATPKALDEIKVLQLMQVEMLHDSLAQVHRDIVQRQTDRRDSAVREHNAKTHVPAANFSVGDFVLVAKRIAKDGHKLRLQWQGPHRVVRTESDWVYEVEDLINESRALVHANCLKFYADSSLEVTEELLDTIDHKQPRYNTVTKFLDLAYERTDRVWKVQTKWRGFDHEEPTWEPLDVMNDDVPEMLTEFLDAFTDQRKVQRARMSLE
eukprot:Plantae.Rhodophyta-Palmaria_palmata.ctg13165.p1 GENE.Plantae.Rhodophyta-Palmaria_palmata.ctg13165~~Plantae.Rhodophyta-Palmaria_palmata.ctg13165.p1  ORF type:complete len:337 (-),score=45.86 Plantae.Rhodophyta-Palmaria_palmata.ctg13165:285-1295(-)